MKLVTQIEIKANAERIWNVLLDFEQYAAWNPFISTIEGIAKPGQKLKVTIQKMRFSPIVQICTPYKKFAWLGKLGVKGLFDGYHYFEILPLNENKCLFVQGEHFSGLLVPLLKKKLKQETLPGFILMNCSLKEFIEGEKVN